MRAFAGVVQAGSFAGAATKLGISNALVSKYVKELEADLGATLLLRTTRKVSVTEIGRGYFERCVRILDDLEDADAIVASLHGEPRGTLRINGPMSFGVLHLGSVVNAFMARHPQIEVELDLTDRMIDVVEDGYDLVVRIDVLEDSSLIARRIAPIRRVLCAAPSYIDRRGVPGHPSELTEHDTVQFGDVGQSTTWRLIGPDGEHKVRIKGAFRSNNGDVVCAAAVDGLGVALLPTFIGCAALEAGKLIHILADYAAPELAVHVLYAPQRALSAKIRLFIDFFAERCGTVPFWDEYAAHEPVTLNKL